MKEINFAEENILRRKNVSLKTKYLDYKEDLRSEFYYSCGYCSMTEVESAGISFQIDHYKPQKVCTDKKECDSYYNLIYSCQVCNRNKSDYYPSNNEERIYFVLRPDRDKLEDHFRIRKEYLEHKTTTGYFNERLLFLNSERLKRIRRIRRRVAELDSYIAFGVNKLNELSIDNLPINLKTEALKIRQSLKKEVDKSSLKMEEIIDALAHSRLLDEEENKSELMAERRKFLKSIKAIV